MTIKSDQGCFVDILDSAGDTYLEGRIRLRDGKLEISYIDCRNNTFTDDGNTVILKNLIMMNLFGIWT